ncbi:hypothetical protein ACFQY0_05485 [Haloferula chungangensis]|uniref:AsmA-like C-terminal domain-containing protein n=1 Tax=Haloferula chungangensis TaxID=1048331 RepID=A0ABW2L5N7_9BACT
MTRQRHGKGRWSRYLLRAAAALLALLLLGFLLLQALLATPWMRGKVAGKLSQRIGGLEVVIGSLSWTPWNGVKIERLEVKQPGALREVVPTPLLAVEEIHIRPDYKAALKGNLSVNELKVLRPKLHVTVDMLISIAAASMPPARPPAIAAVVPAPGSAVGGTSDATPQGAGQGPLTSSGSEEAPAVVAKPDTAAAPAPQPVAKPHRKRVRVVVDDGSFELVKAGMARPLAGVEGVNFDLPLFGEAGESSQSLGMIECLGQTLVEELVVEVKTEDTGIAFIFPGDPTKEFGIFGRMEIALSHGLPFQTDMALRLPKVERLMLSDRLVGECDELQARIQGGGWLQGPGSWRGVAAIEAGNPMGGVGSLDGSMMPFDSASAVLQLAGGVIYSPDFRLLGDMASVLGNGWVNSHDGAVVARLIVPPTAVEMLNGQFVKRVPEGVFAFRPLKPDNRWFSDVSIWREKTGWMVGFGEGGSVAPLDGVLRGKVSEGN